MIWLIAVISEFLEMGLDLTNMNHSATSVSIFRWQYSSTLILQLDNKKIEPKLHFFCSSDT